MYFYFVQNGRLTAGDQLLSVDGQSLIGLSQERYTTACYTVAIHKQNSGLKDVCGGTIFSRCANTQYSDNVQEPFSDIHHLTG